MPMPDARNFARKWFGDESEKVTLMLLRFQAETLEAAADEIDKLFSPSESSPVESDETEWMRSAASAIRKER